MRSYTKKNGNMTQKEKLTKRVRVSVLKTVKKHPDMEPDVLAHAVAALLERHLGDFIVHESKKED